MITLLSTVINHQLLKLQIGTKQEVNLLTMYLIKLVKNIYQVVVVQRKVVLSLVQKVVQTN